MLLNFSSVLFTQCPGFVCIRVSYHYLSHLPRCPFFSVSRPTVVAGTYYVFGSLTCNSCFIVNILCRLNCSNDTSLTVPRITFTRPINVYINVRRYVFLLMSTATRLRCCQCCSLQKDYRLGPRSFEKIMVHVYRPPASRPHSRATAGSAP